MTKTVKDCLKNFPKALFCLCNILRNILVFQISSNSLFSESMTLPPANHIKVPYELPAFLSRRMSSCIYRTMCSDVLWYFGSYNFNGSNIVGHGNICYTNFNFRRPRVHTIDIEQSNKYHHVLSERWVSRELCPYSGMMGLFWIIGLANYFLGISPV